jgi:hypothetical protein
MERSFRKKTRLTSDHIRTQNSKSDFNKSLMIDFSGSGKTWMAMSALWLQKPMKYCSSVLTRMLSEISHESVIGLRYGIMAPASGCLPIER